jgi:hypothetical protein
MRLEHLQHLIGAAAGITEESDFIVIGSQAILATHPDAPEELLVSMEADVYPREAPHKADEIDGVLGDGSSFQQTYGYYAHGVGPETARAPAGWEARLVAVTVPPRPGATRGAVAWCLEVHDLVLAKCAAGRPRDWEFARVALATGVVEAQTLLPRVADLPLNDGHRAHIASVLTGIVADLGLTAA